ncbi:unnamed protein product [Auanema sp. JU1783]|nr:unnamed protein product [Auanema sp. JU1783]
MCVALILLTNSFYKVYYWLFDLCEHALVSLLLLATVFIFFLPVIVNIESDEQRPLFTIAVLVSGVVGGLAVVITAVYLYRFCLKKRPPVTTTCKPEQKREQIRSEQPSQCRPLPLLLEDHSREQTVDTVVERDSGCFGSPTKIAQVFPLMPKETPYVQRSLIQSHQDIPQNTTYQATNQSRASSFLAVGDLPLRAHSAELLSVNDSQEMRRSSCDVPRGTGRQLPSTEGLEVSLFL